MSPVVMSCPVVCLVVRHGNVRTLVITIKSPHHSVLRARVLHVAHLPQKRLCVLLLRPREIQKPRAHALRFFELVQFFVVVREEQKG